jgi:hypothetical protein
LTNLHYSNDVEEENEQIEHSDKVLKIPTSQKQKNKPHKIKNTFNEFYHKHLMALAGQERIIVVLTTSNESIVAKERNFLHKLIDDFGKFKLYQINFAGFRFDYRVHLAHLEIMSMNMIQQQD